MALVDPAISRRKLERELDVWEAQAEVFRQRGYVIVTRDDLRVDVAFHARLPIGGACPLPGMAVCARLDFTNYDLWPPSVTLIDFFTGDPVPPHARAYDFRSQVRTAVGLPPDLLLNAHPDTGLPFLCHVGIREYHRHYEHDGDDWLLYRHESFGTLDAICDLIWRTMTRTVLGLRVEVRQTPPPIVAAMFSVSLTQGDPDAEAEAVRRQLESRGIAPPPPT